MDRLQAKEPKTYKYISTLMNEIVKSLVEKKTFAQPDFNPKSLSKTIAPTAPPITETFVDAHKSRWDTV